MSNVKMPEPEVSLYVQCANGAQIPVRSFSEVQMQAYAQAVRDEALKAVNAAAMNLAANLVLMYYDGNGKLDRDKVMERVVQWRTEWDKAMKEQS